MRDKIRAAALLGLTLAWSACNLMDQIEDPKPPLDGAEMGGADMTASAPDQGDDPAQPGPDMRSAADMDVTPVAETSRQGMRRLSMLQYMRATRSLLGERVGFIDELEPDPVSGGSFAFSSQLASDVVSADSSVDRYARSAEAVAAQVFADAAWRAQVVGCAPSGADDPCIDAFLRRLLRRAWSRPASDAEVARFAEIVAVGERELDLWTGLSMAVAAVLESPSFLYRAHMGEPDPARAGTRRFPGFEMADRMALLLWSDLPDEALLDAAASGALVTEAGLREQATRMLEDARARRGVIDFMSEWFNLSTLNQLSKDEELFPRISHTLGASMREEIEHYFVTRVFDQDLDLMELFTSRQVRINEELRVIYGFTEPVAAGRWEQREVPAAWDRGGLLTSPGIMALTGTRTRTSPTQRGLFVLERLLCIEMEPAPDSLDVSALIAPAGQETVRQWNTRLRMNTQCAGCHDFMDPVGLTFENFDGLGQHRPRELGVEIETAGEVLGVQVADAKELGAFLRTSEMAKNCVVRQALRYANGKREVISIEVEAEIEALAQRFSAQGGRIKPLLIDIITSEAFRTASEGGR